MVILLFAFLAATMAFRRALNPGVPFVMMGRSLDEINSLRAGEIKALLQEKGQSTRGLFEKSELAAKLFEVESGEAPTSSLGDLVGPMMEVPLLDIPLGKGGVNDKFYCGVEVRISGKSYRMIVDTAASMNLIKQNVVAEAGLATQSAGVSQTTIGMGGTGSIAAKVCCVPECILAPGVSLSSLDFAILDSSASLPQGCDGLVGLSFLAALPGSLSEFDFDRQILRAGMDKLPPAGDFAPILLRRLFTGLRACDALLTSAQGETAAIAALVDLGSSYTILNSKAVELLCPGQVLGKLAPSGMKVAGIDGRPVDLKKITLQSISLGGGARFKLARPIDVFAGDIAGFSAIGLGPTVPAALLGMDVLAGSVDGGRARRGTLCLDLKGDFMYLKRRA